MQFDWFEKKYETYFKYLEERYPNKEIVNLSKDRYAYQTPLHDLEILGYKTVREFLSANGYNVRTSKSFLKKGIDLSLVEELKKRYPNGANFKSVKQIIDANPDLSGKFGTFKRTVKTISPELTVQTWLERENYIKK